MNDVTDFPELSFEELENVAGGFAAKERGSTTLQNGSGGAKFQEPPASATGTAGFGMGTSGSS